MRVAVEQHRQENVGQQLRPLLGVRGGRDGGPRRLSHVRVHGIAERARPPATDGGDGDRGRVQPDGDAEAQGQAGDAGGDRRDGRYGRPAHAADDQLLADTVSGRPVGELVAGLGVRGRRADLRVPGEADRTVRVQVPLEHCPVGQHPGGHSVRRPAAPEPVAQAAARRGARPVRVADGRAAEDHRQQTVQTHRIARREVSDKSATVPVLLGIILLYGVRMCDIHTRAPHIFYLTTQLFEI